MNIIGHLQNEPQMMLVEMRRQARARGVEPPNPDYPTLADALDAVQRQPNHAFLRGLRQTVAVLTGR